MANNLNLRGVGVALVTPFKESGEIDFDALTRLTAYVSESVDYLVVMGTTAESPVLSHDEKQAILSHVIQHNSKNLPIVFGIGGNSTAEVVSAVNSFDLTGVGAILSVTPYYNKPNQEGLLAHYSAVIEASALPVILYNVPGRTGINMTATTTLKLAHKYKGKAIAIKEASGNLAQAAYILRDRPEGFCVISGEDNMNLPLIAMGAEGVISVSANCFAPTLSNMVNAALDGDMAKAASLNLNLIEATDLLFAEGNPTGAKAALDIKGLISNNLRLPLVKATKELNAKIKDQIEKYSL